MRGHNLTRPVCEALANALCTPAFASLREIYTWTASSTLFDPLLAAFRSGACKQLGVMHLGGNDNKALSEGSIMQLYEALVKENICPKLRQVDRMKDGVAARLLQSFLQKRCDGI